MRLRPLALASLAACSSGCTAIKPLVCAFTYPIDEMRKSLAAPYDHEEEYAHIPPPLVLIAAPVLIPLRFVGLAAMGIGGGLVSGFASDLNVIIWNFDVPWRNLTRPFRTNARKPKGD